jgi:hypothetical protein
MIKSMKLKYLLSGIVAAALSATGAYASNLATWTFETSIPGVVTLPAAPGAGVYLTNITAEVGTGTAAGFHAGVTLYSSPAGNGSAHSMSSTNWVVGDFYQFAVSTLSAQNIQVSYDQTSSGTGPGQFYLAYSTDGVNFTVALARTNSVQANASPNPTWNGTTSSPIYTTNYDLGAISGINNQPVVYFRVVDASTVSANGGTVAGGGTSRIDNFSVNGSTGTPPAISGVNPPGLTTNAGNAVTLTVTLSQGDTPLFYQWYTQSTDGTISTLIPNATNASLSFPNILGANSTNYIVVVTNNAPSGNIVTSTPVNITVIDPGLNSQPAGQIVVTNGNAQFSALAGGTGLTYQWYFCASSSDNSQLTGPVSDGLLAFSPNAGAIGSTSNILTITNVTTLTQTNFALVVTGTYGSITSSVASLTLGGTAVPLAFWNFNGPFDPTNAAPFQGIGNAFPVNVQSFVQPTRDANDLTPGNNTALGTQNYPAATVSNKQSGVQFNVSTRGAKNIKISFDLRGTATASRYQRLQYTTNGTDFIDYPASQLIGILQVGTYNTYNYDLTGFPGVANNTNFGIRLVTEFESTALYGNTNDATYVGVSSGYSAGGTVSYDLVDITGDAIAGNNQPPTVGTIPATVSAPDTIGTNFTFTATDDSTPAASLVANATSLDPNTSVGFSAVNTAGSIKLTISPSLGIENSVTVPVLLTVADGNGEFTAKSFLLTITPANASPIITGLVNTNMLTNSTIAIPFTLTDDHTPAASLTPSITSSNSLLVPNDAGHLSITGTGTNRTLNITSAPGQSGAAPLYISVTDGGGATTLQTLVVEVRPNTDVMLIDNFDYDNSGSIVTVSGGLWATHSGGAGQMKVGSGVVTNNSSNSEDVNAPLFGAPYVTNMANNISLYASYTLHCVTLPNGTNGSYITHFKDNTTSGFLGRVWAVTNNAALGSFRLAIGNSTQSTVSNAPLATDLSPGVDYNIVVRIRMTNGFSTLWINPTDESSPNVTDTTEVPNLVNIYQYAIRESGGAGVITIDNLKVGTSFAGVTGLGSTTTPPPAPTISGISIGGPGGTNVILTGTNNSGTGGGQYVVLTSTNLTAPISSWSILSTQTFKQDGSFSFTNGITDPSHYYILQVLP